MIAVTAALMRHPQLIAACGQPVQHQIKTAVGKFDKTETVSAHASIAIKALVVYILVTLVLLFLVFLATNILFVS